jgi:hypothetical protein
MMFQGRKGSKNSARGKIQFGNSPFKIFCAHARTHTHTHTHKGLGITMFLSADQSNIIILQISDFFWYLS